jgi:hypothetical protein
MKRLLNLLAFLTVLLVPTFVYAQAYTVFDDYDLDSTSYVYCDTTDIPTGMSACASGTAAGDGWMVKAYNAHMGVSMELDQGNVTGGVDFRIEARFVNDDGSTYSDAIAIWPADGAKNKTAFDGTEDEIQLVPDHVYQIRVGIKIGTADDGNDLTTNLEQISVIVNQYR